MVICILYNLTNIACAKMTITKYGLLLPLSVCRGKDPLSALAVSERLSKPRSKASLLLQYYVYPRRKCAILRFQGTSKTQGSEMDLDEARQNFKLPSCAAR